MKKERIIYFDVLKTIAIFMVIYLHYPWISQSKISLLSMMIPLIAVPIFFMINGALVLNRPIDLKKHYKKILIYYISLIVWKLLTLIIMLSVNKVNLKDFSTYQIIVSLLSNNNLPGVPTEHLWFMYSLIRLYLIIPFIKLVIDNNKKALKIILYFSLFFTFGIEFLNFLIRSLHFFNNSIEIFNFDFISGAINPLTDIRALSYFILGYWLHNKYYSNNECTLNAKIIVKYSILFILGLLCLVFARYIQTGTVLSGQYVNIINDYNKVGTLIMSISVFIIFSKIKFKKFKIFTIIGSKTFNIYYIHMIIAKLSLSFIQPTIGINGSKINFVRTLVILIVSLIITTLLRKIKPIKKVLNLA